MYEILASGVADRTPTAQDLNIPDPPAGADPQMAAGFVGGSAAMPSSPDLRAAVPVAVVIPGPAGWLPPPSTGSQWPVFGGQGPAVGGPTGSQAGPEPTLVIQGPEHDHGRDPGLTRPDAGEVLDAMLADLVTDADRSRGEEGDGNRGVPGFSGAGEVEDAIEPERIPPDRIDPTGVARPLEPPPRVRSFGRSLIRMDTMSDGWLDELAAAVVVSSGRVAVPADPITRPETPPEPDKGLAKLAATLIVAGSWSHRARFRGATSRHAGRPGYHKESE
jgi:hypothetical protein